jgi:methylenetetrahydrofolate--tRNA-(uracil-5-)-methyltransferase
VVAGHHCHRPLTSDALSQSIQQMVGEEHLAFYDAISPIVLAESIDMSKVFRARAGDAMSGVPRPVRALEQSDEGDYSELPDDEGGVRRVLRALVAAESATVHDFDNTKFFEGCLPIEVMAHRGEGTLRFGPMKPVGLEGSAHRQLPYAVVQLRQDTLAGDHYSLVGFQTQIKWGDQARLLRMIPGARECGVRPLRHGASQHLYLRAEGVVADVADAPARRPVVRRAGVGRRRLRRVRRVRADSPAATPPRLRRAKRPRRRRARTAIGSLADYVSHADPKNYQPTDITHGIMPPLDNPPRDKMKKKMLIAERALADLDRWSRRRRLVPCD